MAHPTVENLRAFIEANRFGRLLEPPHWRVGPVGTAVSWHKSKLEGSDLLTDGTAGQVQARYDALPAFLSDRVLDDALVPLGCRPYREYSMFMISTGAGGLNPSAPSPWKANFGFDLKRYPSGCYVLLFGQGEERHGRPVRVHALSVRIDVVHDVFEWFDPGTAIDTPGMGIEVSTGKLDGMLMTLTQWIDQRYRVFGSFMVKHYLFGDNRVDRRAGAPR